MAAVTVTVISEPKKIVCHCFHFFPIYLPWSDGTRCHDLSFLKHWILSQVFDSLTLMERLFSVSSLFPIKVVSSAYLKLFVFFLAILIPACDSFSSVQSLSHVLLFATPWIATRQASLSITNSGSSLKLTSIESVMPSSHLILRRALLLLPPIPPSIRVSSNESTLRMRWPKCWSFSLSSFLPKKSQGWSPSEWTGWISFNRPPDKYDQAATLGHLQNWKTLILLVASSRWDAMITRRVRNSGACKPLKLGMKNSLERILSCYSLFLLTRKSRSWKQMKRLLLTTLFKWIQHYPSVFMSSVFISVLNDMASKF